MTVETLLQQASAAYTAGQLDQAAALYTQVLKLETDQPNALEGLAGVAFQAGRINDCIDYLQRIAARYPSHHETWSNLGLCYANVGRMTEAVTAFGQAAKLDPNNFSYALSLAEALNAAGQTAQAVDEYKRALALNPNDETALASLASALFTSGRHAEAAPLFARLSQKPTADIGLLGNQGVAYLELGQYDDALATFERALKLEPNNSKLLINRGLVLMKLKRFADAIPSFEQGMAGDTDVPFARGEKLNAALYVCQWRDYASDIALIERGISSGQKVSYPFQVLATIPSPALQLKAAEIFAADTAPHMPQHYGTPPPVTGKIRVAVLSSDLRMHAVSTLVVECLENIDRERFELYGIYFGPPADDDMHHRLKRLFHEFIDVRAQSDQATAELVAARGIHIAIDLNGHIDLSRTKIFARRPAPIQVNYLGYPGTMGTPYHDYIVADRHIIPAGFEAHYSEKVVRLPDTYQPNQSYSAPQTNAPSRRQLGLPEDAFVFCSFNGTFKTTPVVFDSWAQILKAVPNSVLWLLDPGEQAVTNLKREALVRGVSPHRLIFAKRLPLSLHLQRYVRADLFLDTWPYNAHTTASDSLRMGLPVLTYCGEAFAARVAASLLHAVGLPQLIATSAAEYEALAIRFATEPQTLQNARASLQANLPTAALFDVRRYTAHFEQALQHMFDTWRAGQPPRAFDVPA
jgi:predicted O-linked N-acetylglucosamine transferase (SPINDLY family)